MARSTDEHGVDGGESGIFLRAHHVVFADLERGFWERRAEGGCPSVKERGEYSAVPAVFGIGVLEGSVAFEDGDAEGGLRHGGLGWMCGIWRIR